MIQLADRMSLVAESITLAVGAKAKAMQRQGIDVVLFGAGEPDFDTPAFIKESCKAALDKGQTKYTPTPCIPELKEAIAKKFQNENGLAYKPENITTGTSVAAAHVSGVVALILARKPDADPETVRAILQSSAKDLGPSGKDEQFGAGLTDAYQAVLELEPARATAGTTGQAAPGGER